MPRHLFDETHAQVIDLIALGFRVEESLTNSGWVGSNASFFLGTTPSPGFDMYENLPNPDRVFTAERLAVTLDSERIPAEFNLILNFEKVFRYNRLSGALILEGKYSYAGRVLDAEWSKPEQGYVLWLGPSVPCCETRHHDSVLVTKIYYLVPTVFLEIEVRPEWVELMFQSEEACVRLESAESIKGPFMNVGVIPEQAGPGLFRAIVEKPPQQRFWRISHIVL
jgi:hypothetical protein